MLLYLSFIGFLLAFLQWGALVSTSSVVDTGYAKYLGNRTFSNTVAYLGIPYAEPPVGERRFRAPLPLNTTRVKAEAASRGTKLIDATEYPDFCVQGSIGAGEAGGAGSEDCLKLNIYTPYGAKRGSNLPVLVYIHGGGYHFGNPHNWPFEHWIHQSPNVVIASVYYRLSSFGFLTHPDFRDGAVADLNAGFQDQIQALKWIQRYIPAFGGNPGKVTINGESAGGSSVELHLVAREQRKEKLFHAAIAQSVYRAPLATPEQKEALFQFYATQAGCPSGTVAERVSCLRQAPISALALAQDVSRTAAFAGPYRSFQPVVDGRIIADYPTQSIIGGDFAEVPLIVGSTSNETSGSGTDIAVTLKSIFPGLEDADLDAYLNTYPASDYATPAQRHQVAIGETIFICARSILSEAYSKTSNVWTYRYNQRNPTGTNPGVGHAAENWMMFLGSNTGFNGSVTFSPMTPVENAFAAELIGYWLSFTRSHNPNTFKLSRSPRWVGYSTQSKPRIVLQQSQTNSTTDTGSFVEPEPIHQGERCEFVKSMAKKEQN